MASILKVDKLDPQSGTALEIGTSGDTISVPSGATLDISASTLTPPATMPASSGVNLTALNATQLTSGTLPDARFTTLPAVSGVNLTALNATNLGSGTVPTARLGTGTASSSTVLYGDQTYKAEPGGGKILQVQSMYTSTEVYYDTNTSFVDTGVVDSITPSATSSKILILVTIQFLNSSTSDAVTFKPMRAGTSLGEQQDLRATGITSVGVYSYSYTDSPSSTSATEYKVMFRKTGGVGGIHAQTSGTSTSSMTLLEIGV